MLIGRTPRRGMGDAVAAPRADACPAGWGVPTFTDGVKEMISGLPLSLLGGFLELPLLGKPNPGYVDPPAGFITAANPANVVGPPGCYVAARENTGHVLGMASGSLAVVVLLFSWMFGGRR